MTLFATDITLVTQEAFLKRTAPLGGVGYFFQVIFSLLVIVALIYVTLKFLLPKLSVSTKGKFIQVLDRVPLEPSVTAYILKVARQSFLVVVSAKSVSYIDKVETPENVTVTPPPATR